MYMHVSLCTCMSAFVLNTYSQLVVDEIYSKLVDKIEVQACIDSKMAGL